MPNRANRQRARDTLEDVGEALIDAAVETCAFLGLRPVLTGLAIADGALGAAPTQWTTVHAVTQVRLLATTNPNRTGAGHAIAWDTDGATVAAWRRNVSRAVVGDFTVGATLNSPRKQVLVAVFDLTNLVSDLPLAYAGTTRKGYAGYVPGNTATLTATTNPDHTRVWQHLNWDRGTPSGDRRTCRVNVAAVGDIPVTVTLGTLLIGQLQQRVVLHICQWPGLEVTEITFSNGHVINNDTTANFDRFWRRARIGAVAPNPINPPECYTRNTTVRLSARLRVHPHPTDTETVQVRGRATIGLTTMTWTSGNIIVNPGDNEVSFPAAVDADQPLPDQVNFYQAARINWEMTDPNGNWIPIGSTTHDLYATLGDPVGGGPVYWTLLHYSCVNAATTTAAAAFIPLAFNSYTGRNIRRKRDNKPMTYWDPRAIATPNGNTAALLGADTTRQLVSTDYTGLPNPGSQQVATGHCGSWAESFVDMLKIHGLASGHKVNVTRGAPLTRNDPTALGLVDALAGGFLVATWNFNGPPALRNDALTHQLWTTARPGAYAPGQNNPTPPPAFANHFVVWCTTNNTLYDPSYGTHFHGVNDAATLLAWEMGSISGLNAFNDPVVPNAGYATAAVPAPGRRLRFYDMVAGANL